MGIGEAEGETSSGWRLASSGITGYSVRRAGARMDAMAKQECFHNVTTKKFIHEA